MTFVLHFCVINIIIKTGDCIMFISERILLKGLVKESEAKKRPVNRNIIAVCGISALLIVPFLAI